MGDVFKRLVREGIKPSPHLFDIIHFFLYRENEPYAKARKTVRTLQWAFYQLRMEIAEMAKQTKKPNLRKQLETHWCAMDVRNPDEKKRAIEYMINSDTVLADNLDVLLAGGNLTWKAGENENFIGFAFIPVKHEKFSTIGIRAESRDPYKMAGTLAYKYAVMLPEYVLPDVDDEDEDFR